MMFDYFKDMKVDYVILEVGMGGRYDVINICDNIVLVIINVSLEYIEYLGDIIYKIVKEKVGIIKNCFYIIFVDNNFDVKKVIEEVIDKYVNVLEKYKDSIYKLDFNIFLINIFIDGNKYEYFFFGDY